MFLHHLIPVVFSLCVFDFIGPSAASMLSPETIAVFKQDAGVLFDYELQVQELGPQESYVMLPGTRNEKISLDGLVPFNSVKSNLRSSKSSICDDSKFSKTIGEISVTVIKDPHNHVESITVDVPHPSDGTVDKISTHESFFFRAVVPGFVAYLPDEAIDSGDFFAQSSTESNQQHSRHHHHESRASFLRGS